MKTIINLLERSEFGLTITELTKKSQYSRSKVRTLLAELRGANKIKFINIGMAKVYSIKK